MSAADQRLAELLERWKTSLDLHARYLLLDDAAYAKVQGWPKHQRPSRWVLEHARSRLLELRRMVDERSSRGDAGFAEALELMAFLTSLLGSGHVDRFIPLAQPQPTEPPPAPASRPSTDEPAVDEQATTMVVADAVRLIGWGREWPQLAGLIARLAGRPPEADVWKILRKHRAAIDAQVRRPRD
jgi:hypothetical protein